MTVYRFWVQIVKDIWVSAETESQARIQAEQGLELDETQVGPMDLVATASYWAPSLLNHVGSMGMDLDIRRDWRL